MDGKYISKFRQYSIFVKNTNELNPFDINLTICHDQNSLEAPIQARMTDLNV